MKRSSHVMNAHTHAARAQARCVFSVCNLLLWHLGHDVKHRMGMIGWLVGWKGGKSLESGRSRPDESKRRQWRGAGGAGGAGGAACFDYHQETKHSWG